MEKNNGYKFAFFGIILLVIIVGGFILMRQSDPAVKKKVTPKKEPAKTVDIRNNKDEDYIYFENDEPVVEDLDLVYKDIVINFDTTSDVASKQNEETKEFRKTVKFDEDLEDDEYDKLVSAKYKTYEYYTYEDFISLVVNYYTFDRENLISFIESKTYVFDKQTGRELSEDELLKAFELTKDEALAKIKEYVDGQDLLDDEIKLDGSATISNISILPIYVDKVGRLSASVLVKCDQKDYNEVIVLS